MEDIVERIRGLRYVHVPQASQLFEEAIAEIERLRITDEEREAIRSACGSVKMVGTEKCFTTLLGLLERLA